MSIKNSLYQLVGHSSLQYLVQHMYIVYTDTQVLLDFFNDVLHGNWEAANADREKMIELTQQARDMLQKASSTLDEDLFAPVIQKEVIRLLQLQTQIANKALAITGLVLGRQLNLPPSVGAEFFPMLNKSIAAIYQTYDVINHLEKAAGAKAQKAFIQDLNHMIVELDTLENETDKGQILARNAVFALESELYSVDVMGLYKMLEWTAELADKAHDLGGKLVSMLAK